MWSCNLKNTFEKAGGALRRLGHFLFYLSPASVLAIIIAGVIMVVCVILRYPDVLGF